MVIYGSFERWRWERKGGGGGREGWGGVLLEYTLICGTWGNDGKCMGRWRWRTMCSGGSLLLGIQGCEGGIHLLLWLQWMPLGDGATGVG